VVWLDNEIIGKPHDREDAYRILRKLSGRTHTVYTGIAVLTDDSTQLCHETTRVTFEDLSDELIWDYIATGDPMDKAGSYGVQGLGAVLVKKVEGCYFTVIGMSIPRLCDMLKNVGIYPRWQTRCAEK
ncbi:MAG: septum formation protein Maf, partial [Clostridia bacterium]|nr:septum formation protein Maf [Clostridia bacterium]